MITIKNLSKRYGDKLAVDDLTFSVAPGEVLGFLGANGAGKSTTMRMIAGFISPTAGQVSVCGHDIEKAPVAGQILHGIFAGRRAELRRNDGERISRLRRGYPRLDAASGGASDAAS